MTDPQYTPLAERVRPSSIDEFIGHDYVMDSGKVVHAILNDKIAFSLILWGDPGTGKTTLAKLIAQHCDMDTYFLSAISAGVADVRKVIKQGIENKAYGKQTLLFLDEIHRFNKAQQDSVLGAVEAGDIVLIGATTENPSFNVIAPLLSRTRIITLKKLSEKNLKTILENAITHDKILTQYTIDLAEEALEMLLQFSNGDARRLLNVFESAFQLKMIKGKSEIFITKGDIEESLQQSVIYYDKAGDKHYDTISAFIKSLRGSDPNGAVYYLAKMLLAGEDPVFIARRMVIFASEDIGNAAPTALNLAVSALTAVKNIGMPESEIILSHCATFLASAPKSNASYLAIKEAKNIAAKINDPIPMHLLNAPTEMMKNMDYGKGYKYPHDFDGHFIKEDYLPERIKNSLFYRPSPEGGEKAILERLKKLWPEKYS